MLWKTSQNPHATVYNSAIAGPAWRAMWTTVDNRRTTPTVPTRQNEGFPQVHNPYYNNKKNTASS